MRVRVRVLTVRDEKKSKRGRGVMGSGLARNEYLGPACNKNLLNIILKSIGYKIINLHISSYT